jgi:hypothetical protein
MAFQLQPQGPKGVPQLLLFVRTLRVTLTPFVQIDRMWGQTALVMQDIMEMALKQQTEVLVAKDLCVEIRL